MTATEPGTSTRKSLSAKSLSANPLSAGEGIRLSSLVHFLEHQFVRFRTTWTSTLITAVANPLFFLLAVGYGLGSQVDDSQVPTGDYITFVGPGVMAASAMMQGSSLSLWPTMAALKWEGIYEAALSTPLTSTELATGHILWIGFRALITAALYTVVLAFFGVVSSPLALLAPLAAGLTSMAFAAPLSAFSAGRESDLSFSVILRLVITPMFLFSGAFFPIDQLPDAVAAVARFIPVWHGVELCRHLINGSGDLATHAVHLGYLLVFIVGGWWWATRSFRGRLAS